MVHTMVFIIEPNDSVVIGIKSIAGELFGDPADSVRMCVWSFPVDR